MPSLDETEYLLQAIEALDKKLAGSVETFELNVIGGFAMLLNGIRPSTKGATYTDIDYIGSESSPIIETAIREVGISFGLGRDWINNDVLLYGSTIEELELLTGPLHFKKVKVLTVITINVLIPEDLLRMKLLAVDTALMAVDAGDEFTRSKDIPDIKYLVEYLKISSIEGIRALTASVDIAPSTYDFIAIRVFG